MQIEICRPIVFGMRLSEPEEHAILLLAKREGLPKSLFARRILRLAINDHAKHLPADLLRTLNQVQA